MPSRGILYNCAGFWMASRKRAPHAVLAPSEPSRAVDSQRTAAAQGSVPSPELNPSPRQPPPGPASAGTSSTSPRRASAAEAPGAPQPSAQAPTHREEPDGLPRVTLSGVVTETREYCGGANPSDEILEALRRPQPVAHHKLYVRRGSKNALANPILLEFTTDADGKFRIELPEGEYCLIEEGKKGALKIPDFTEENRKLAQTAPLAMPYKLTSPNCLTDWWRACDKVLRVGKQPATGIQVEFHRGCRPPCVEGGPDVI